MPEIKVGIKCNGRECAYECRFFRQGGSIGESSDFIEDECELFGFFSDDDYDTDEQEFPNRHKECVASEILEGK